MSNLARIKNRLYIELKWDDVLYPEKGSMDFLFAVVLMKYRTAGRLSTEFIEFQVSPEIFSVSRGISKSL